MAQPKDHSLFAVCEEYNAPNSALQTPKPTDYVQHTLFDSTIPYSLQTQNISGATRRFDRPHRKAIAWPKRVKRPTGDFVHKATQYRKRTKSRPRRYDTILLSTIVGVLESIDLNPIITAIKPLYTTGRKGYDLHDLLLVHLSRYILDKEFVSEWLMELVDNPRLASICRLRGRIPSESTLCRFNAKLSKIPDTYYDLVVRLVDGIGNKITELHQQDPDRYPGLATEVAIDATAISAFSNPNKKAKDGGVSDKDAQWGKRHKANSPEDMVWYFGYKMHTIADANYEFPIVFDTTHAKRSDIRLLRPLYDEAKNNFPWYGPKYFLGDKGYDSEAMHRYLRQQGTDGLIPPRKPRAKDGLYDGIFNADGDPTCMGKVGMEFVQTDPRTKRHLYRCRPEGCRLKTEGMRGILHCDDEAWFDPEDNPRAMGAIPRNSREWRRLYRKRWSVERIFNSLKHSRLLERHRYRGMAKLRTHVISTVVGFLSTMLAHLQQDNVDHMVRMKVRRA